MTFKITGLVNQKVLLIDSLYKTNLKDQISVAEHIYEIAKLDEELNKGNIIAVDKVAKWNNIFQNKTFNLLSFSSKFCHFHNKKAYPIYDKYVVIALKNLIPGWKDKKTFSNFIEGIDKLRKESNIPNIQFEELDKFLWLFGMLLRLNAGKKDINREIYAYYENHKDDFNKLME